MCRREEKKPHPWTQQTCLLVSWSAAYWLEYSPSYAEGRPGLTTPVMPFSTAPVYFRGVLCAVCTLYGAHRHLSKR